MQVNLSDNHATRVKELLKTRPNKTFSDLVSQVFETGLWQLEYRTQRNKQVSEEKREFKEWKAKYQGNDGTPLEVGKEKIASRIVK